MKFDRYNLEARFLPTIIASLPFFVLYFLNHKLNDFCKFIFSIKIIADISISVAFLILLAFIGRAISKDIFENWWFKSDETKMPTTDFLLYSNSEYSNQFKNKIHQKVKNDFKIKIPSNEDELKNEYNSRKIISEAVSLIRNALKNGRLLLERNIEYGFIRNLIGCSVIAVMVSILNIIIFFQITFNHIVLILSISMTILYSFPLIFSKILIKKHGKRYARTLFQEYIGG